MSLAEVYADYQTDPRVAHLRVDAKRFVGSRGPEDAELMLIGEAPGADEDSSGVPFVGRAGQELKHFLVAAGIEPEMVFITNAVKYRPPLNRTPRPFEVGASLDCLLGEINLVKPNVIVTLGATALFALLPNFSLTRDAGQWVVWRDTPTMPTYHPAAALRDPAKRAIIIQALKQAKEKLP